MNRRMCAGIGNTLLIKIRDAEQRAPDWESVWGEDALVDSSSGSKCPQEAVTTSLKTFQNIIFNSSTSSLI